MDVFKTTKLNEWTLGQKEGDVTEVYDKELAKNIFKIGGATTASNYIQLPASKHLPKKTLGLISKYVSKIFLLSVTGLFSHKLSSWKIIRNPL